MFKTRNVPAALYKSIGSFASNGVNLLKLESYLEGRGRFRAASFYAEIFGRPSDAQVKLAMEELAFFSSEYSILGVYPADPSRKDDVSSGFARAAAPRPAAPADVEAEAEGENWQDALARLRHTIDNIDAAVIHLLAERFKTTRQVGALKAAHALPSTDAGREAQQLERLRRLAAAADLDPDFAEKFLAFVIAEVIRHHDAAKKR
jgi:chorismate mutase